LEVVLWILKYFRGTSHYSLCFAGFNAFLQGYVDSDMINDLDGGKALHIISLPLVVQWLVRSLTSNKL